MANDFQALFLVVVLIHFSLLGEKLSKYAFIQSTFSKKFASFILK
jgi:hypothetical protein